MERPAFNNKKGFSLVELMIAMMIILITMLALLTSILTSISVNASNEIRDAAMRITNETAEALLALPMDDPELSTDSAHANTFSAGPKGQQIKGFPNPKQKIRSYEIAYAVTWTVTQTSENLKKVGITVTYNHRNRDYSHSSLIYRHRTL